VVVLAHSRWTFGPFFHVPRRPVAVRKMVTRGGLAASSRLTRYCRHQNAWRTTHENAEPVPASAERLTAPEGRPFLYGGIATPHFGHFVAEHIHRLWPLGRPGLEDATVLFVAEKKWTEKTEGRLPAFFEEVLAYYGVRHWRIIDMPCVVDRLIIGESGKILRRPAHPAYAAELRRIAGLHTLADPTFPKKVALLRGHLPRGRLLGEAWLGRYLEGQGYTPVRPEELSFPDQLKTIYNAERIIVSDGSACHLFDSLPPVQASVAFLARRPNAQLDKNSLRGKVRALASFRDVSVLVVPQTEEGPAPRNSGLSYVPLEGLVRFLKDHDFVPAEAPPLGQVPYFDDFRDYARRYLKLAGRSETPRDLMIEVLARTLHERNHFMEAKRMTPVRRALRWCRNNLRLQRLRAMLRL
jgi:hypothetical protein